MQCFGNGGALAVVKLRGREIVGVTVLSSSKSSMPSSYRQAHNAEYRR